MSQTKPTGWTGWVYFAGAMMLLLGGLQALSGLVGIFKDTFYVVGQSALVAFSYTTWGWINLIVGILIFLAGLAVMNGSAWGRVIGVFLAVLSAVANVAFLPSYPIWSVIALLVDLMVIFALTVHGAEVRER